MDGGRRGFVGRESKTTEPQAFMPAPGAMAVPGRLETLGASSQTG